MLTPFDHQLRTRIVFGEGAADQVGELTRTLGRSALLVTDSAVAAAGHAERVRASLAAAGLAVAVYDGVRENPTESDVAACRDAATAADADVLVGLGGGSSIDTARGAGFLLAGGGRMADYRGYGLAARPLPPLVAVPTTAGTGSECQSYALICRDGTHEKIACGDPSAAARVAVLDPTLTVTQPAHVTADTGLDALVHAVETAVTARRTPMSLLFAHEAFRRIHRHLPAVLERPDDLEARAHMQLGAALAGLAIEASMLGAAHAAANPLTARHGVVHGQAVALMLPAVVRYNSQAPEARAAYADLARGAGLALKGTPEDEAVGALLSRIERLTACAGVPRTLAAHGIPRSEIPRLASMAAAEWTGRFNPRPVDAAAFEELYADVAGEQQSP